jgi:hypothetical protein
MRSAIACVIALALIAGCGEDDDPSPAAPSPAPSSALADLMVRVDGDGPGDELAKEFEVRCAEAQDSALCTGVASLSKADFAPTPPDTVCTQQYGGPQTAHVTGTLRGEPIDARFSREQGCEISRWDAVVPILDRNPIP